MKKAIVIVNLILLAVVLFISISTITYAWFSYTEKTQPIMFYVSTLKVESKLYYHVNPEYNGDYDQDDDTHNTYEEIMDSMTFLKVVPGQIYTFKLVTKNLGTIDGHLTIDYELSETSNFELAKLMDYIYTNPNDKSSQVKPIYDGVNQTSNLFSGVTLIPYEDPTYVEHVFFFHIKINGTIGNVYTNETVTIRQLNIRLDQIQI